MKVAARATLLATAPSWTAEGLGRGDSSGAAPAQRVKHAIPRPRSPSTWRWLNLNGPLAFAVCALPRVPWERLGAWSWLQWLASGLEPLRRGLEVPDWLILGSPDGGTNLDLELGEPVTCRSVTGRRIRRVTAVSIDVDDAALASRQLAAATGC